VPAAQGVRSAGAPEQIDVGGIRLGMTPEQVRAALKVRPFANYFESTDSLAATKTAAPGPAMGSRFVNEIAAWSRTAQDAESYEILFTPVPGKERAVAVVHSVTYATGAGVTVSALQSALLRKYGGFAAASDLPPAATWRLQSNGQLETGDACARRNVVGGLAQADPALNRDNLSLRTTADEFRYEIQQCGVALITSDHAASASGAAEAIVHQYTVSAYSPSIGLEGATAAAQLIQSGIATSGNGTGHASRGGSDTPIL
jgi:hypothetical protein